METLDEILGLGRIAPGAYIKLPNWENYYKVAYVHEDKRVELYLTPKYRPCVYSATWWGEWIIQGETNV